MKTIYGTIGYTIMERSNNKIIILADMHDKLPNCSDDEIIISDWFKSKFNTSDILLEEVPRDNVDLQELWSNSPHTQKLKKLFLDNPNIIDAIDIRPFMIPYSWEIVDEMNDCSLKSYLKGIDIFYSLKDSYIRKKTKNYKKKYLKNTDLGKHFLIIKNKYKLFLENNNKYLYKNIKFIYENDINVLENINHILNDIMEWYICSKIYSYKNKPIILHTGLAHSDKIIIWLLNNYNYKIISQEGINKMNDNNYNLLSGCIKLSKNFEQMFGGNIINLNLSY